MMQIQESLSYSIVNLKQFNSGFHNCWVELNVALCCSGACMPSQFKLKKIVEMDDFRWTDATTRELSMSKLEQLMKQRQELAAATEVEGEKGRDGTSAIERSSCKQHVEENNDTRGKASRA